MVQVARSDDFRARLEPLGFAPITDETPAAFGAYLRDQERVWEALVRASGATME
jgi:tripartite-type tricarboxylate transporter receptor subunit TctC